MNVITITDTKIPIKNSWTRNQDLFLHAKDCGDHIVTTPSELGDTDRRALTLESPCKRLRWSFDSEQKC